MSEVAIIPYNTMKCLDPEILQSWYDLNTESNIMFVIDSNIDAITISNNKKLMAIGDYNRVRYAININDIQSSFL